MVWLGIRYIFIPGQFVSIKVNLGVNEQIRQYSLSDSPNNKYLRITIKREANYDENTKSISRFIYDNFNINDLCQISTPYGTFKLKNDNNDITFISAGVGITPIMSMLKTLQEEKSEHKINFIYLTENSNYHIFKEALANIELPYLNKYIYYNNPQQDDFIGKDYEKTQFDIQELKRFAATNTNYYLCANSSLIDMLESSLIDLSISQENIFHEAFQPNKWV